MNDGLLHITSGDCCGESLAKANLPGEVFVWHDILYDGPRNPGWPTEETLLLRARFLEDATGGGLSAESVLDTLRAQYRKLAEAADRERIVLWFDACLFDQAMLAHVLACLDHLQTAAADLLVVDRFPGIEPYHGLGQMTPDQLACVADDRRPVTEAQFRFAVSVDEAFATQDRQVFSDLAALRNAPIPWVPAAVARWLDEFPDPETGLGKLERLVLQAVQAGRRTPDQIHAFVDAAETPPRFWGDIMLWAIVNGLAERSPPLLRIEGPADRLPQWQDQTPLDRFTVALALE